MQENPHVVHATHNALHMCIPTPPLLTKLTIRLLMLAEALKL
jgi:hypothetical protein